MRYLLASGCYCHLWNYMLTAALLLFKASLLIKNRQAVCFRYAGAIKERNTEMNLEKVSRSQSWNVLQGKKKWIHCRLNDVQGQKDVWKTIRLSSGGKKEGTDIARELYLLNAAGGRAEDRLEWNGVMNSCGIDQICEDTFIHIYTGCTTSYGHYFGRVFLMINYTGITQNTYIESWTVTEILAIEICGLLGCRRTVRRPWRHTCPMRPPANETW